MNIVELLDSRGLLENSTNPELAKFLEKPAVVYAGFDPTHSSLQAGNLVTIMTLSHFQRCGHHVIALVGGATGMVGDPSGRDDERPLLSDEEVRGNTEKIRENLSRFLDFEHSTVPARILDNRDWLGSIGLLDFLRDVGKHSRMGAMLGRESVRARLNSEGGLSYTEFSYQMLQAYDFLYLFDTLDCTVQVGGSDQWGNITAGIELIRRLRNAEAYGLVTPLVCDSEGQKFGKSLGNAVFLSAENTSPFDFYQFFVRSADADVIRYLKVFTHISLDEIAKIESEVERQPEARLAQKQLADAVTEAVHGAAGLRAAQGASAVMYGESMQGLDAEMLMGILSDVPSGALSRSAVVDQPVVDVAVAGGLCKSKGAARRLIQEGGLYLNNARVAEVESRVQAGDVIGGQLLVLRQGKKRFHLVKVQ
jgi:tyrosyl-tRNA synthetase